MSEFYPKAYEPAWELQTDATVAEAPPGSGTKYTLLATTANVKIISISAVVTWTVQPTPLEIHLTVDGVPVRFAQTDPVSTTNYYPKLLPQQTAILQQCATTVTAATLSALGLCTGRSVKVEVETTGGTVQNLDARIKYAIRVVQ